MCLETWKKRALCWGMRLKQLAGVTTFKNTSKDKRLNRLQLKRLLPLRLSNLYPLSGVNMG